MSSYVAERGKGTYLDSPRLVVCPSSQDDPPVSDQFDNDSSIRHIAIESHSARFFVFVRRLKVNSGGPGSGVRCLFT